MISFIDMYSTQKSLVFLKDLKQNLMIAIQYPGLKQVPFSIILNISELHCKTCLGLEKFEICLSEEQAKIFFWRPDILKEPSRKSVLYSDKPASVC